MWNSTARIENGPQRWSTSAYVGLAGSTLLFALGTELYVVEERPQWGLLFTLLGASLAAVAWPGAAGADPAIARSRRAMVAHLTVVVLGHFFLPLRILRPIWPLMTVAVGVSLFVLTGLVHEASHRLFSRTRWFNELAGNLAGWLLGIPLSAYRAFHSKHHQATNHDEDPNTPLNRRSMLIFGAPTYVALIHWYAWTHLRGRALARYVAETIAMLVVVGGVIALLPHAVRERVILGPLVVVFILQNIRIVTEHLDLPAGRFHDTWQLVLPAWLSRWLLHYDHHLEHHLRPGLHWFELPRYRDELAKGPARQEIHRVTLAQFFREVYLAPAPHEPVPPPAPPAPATRLGKPIASAMLGAPAEHA